jgi:hypothetical protein
VDREADVDAELRELVVQLTHLVLRLRHRHAVAGMMITLLATDRMPGGFLGRGGLGELLFAVAALLVCTCPNAPKSTLVKLRFIALHMTIDRTNPDAPSSAPATISRRLSSTKPMKLALRPA